VEEDIKTVLEKALDERNAGVSNGPAWRSLINSDGDVSFSIYSETEKGKEMQRLWDDKIAEMNAGVVDGPAWKAYYEALKKTELVELEGWRENLDSFEEDMSKIAANGPANPAKGESVPVDPVFDGKVLRNGAYNSIVQDALLTAGAGSLEDSWANKVEKSGRIVSVDLPTDRHRSGNYLSFEKQKLRDRFKEMALSAGPWSYEVLTPKSDGYFYILLTNLEEEGKFVFECYGQHEDVATYEGEEIVAALNIEALQLSNVAGFLDQLKKEREQ